MAGGILPVITDDIFKQRVHNIVGDEYTPLTPYVNSTTKVKFRHNICGHLLYQTPNHFLRDKRRCQYCHNGNRKSPELFAKKFKEIMGDEYTQLESYYKSHEKILVKHNKCDRTYRVTPDSILQGRKCPLCNGTRRKKPEEFSDEVTKLTNGEYSYISGYKNNRSEVLFKHLSCGKVYKARPHDFLNGNRCPYCNQSKGEKMIQDVLDELNITYEIQKYFKDCGNKNQWLPFDFYIPSLNLLLEYDGIQHFKPVKYFGGMNKLKDQQRRDKVKNDYAKEKGISLLRIPYNLKDSYVKNKLKNILLSCKAEKPLPKVGFMI